MKKVARTVMWMGRATVFTVGLAMTLALMIGVATTALAAVPGDPFELGGITTVNAVSTLVGNVSGPTLSVENDESNRAATALNLRMGNPNLAPMQTNVPVAGWSTSTPMPWMVGGIFLRRRCWRQGR